MSRTRLRLAGFLTGICIGLGLLLAVQWARSVPRSELLVFLEQQGCVIGPATRSAAREAGFSDADIDALARRARLVGRAETQRDWLVLSPEICTIHPPRIVTSLHLDAPEIRKYFTARDAGTAEGRPGCFLDLWRMSDSVQERFGWDADKARLEYTRLVGASLLSGELRFYSADPDILPFGLQLMTGECGDVPAQAAIRQSHEFLLQQFDPLVRFAAAITPCEKGATAEPALVQLMADRLSDEKGGNAWISAELDWIAQAAGWYEGMVAPRSATPRPPYCHYEPAGRG